MDNLIRIGNRAVRKAQEENRRLGIPNVYSINGTLLYELPDGTLTTENPFHTVPAIVTGQKSVAYRKRKHPC